MNTPPTHPASETEIAIARQKSYVGSAIITLIAYWFFWLPGLIFNIMYINDAKRSQAIAGHKLPGVGCLWILLLLNVAWILVLCGLLSGGTLLGLGGMGSVR